MGPRGAHTLVDFITVIVQTSVTFQTRKLQLKLYQTLSSTPDAVASINRSVMTTAIKR
jgi:hypothetical protein